MLLALKSVARFYGSRLVFKDVSLAVEPGTVTLLAGANGAGKSTLLKLMAGLIRPSAGKVEYGENTSRTGTGRTEPLTGFLGHQTFIYPDLTALENLEFWSELHGCKHTGKELQNALERVELAPFAEEKAKGFSRGMAQRLNLARVFLLQPDILLLDEPGTGLDTRSMDILYREIAGARADGAGIVWITHTLDSDLQRADNVAVVGSRRLLFYGSVQEYRAHCRDSGTAAPTGKNGEQVHAACAAGQENNQGGEPC